MARRLKNPEGLTVVPVKHRPMEWGYVIVNQNGRTIASGRSGPMGGPLVRKGAARAAGAARLAAMLENQGRIEKALKRRR